MSTNKDEMRELAAQFYAVVLSTMSGNDFHLAVQNLIKCAKDSVSIHFNEYCVNLEILSSLFCPLRLLSKYTTPHFRIRLAKWK